MSKECVTHHFACDCREEKFKQLEQENAALQDAIEESEEFARKNGETCGSKIRELLRENAALREAKDAYFKHNNILVELMTEEQKKKALEILMSRPKEAQR